MAIFSTHTLDSTDGTHAGSIRIRIYRISQLGVREILIDDATDIGGRFIQEIAIKSTELQCEYELVIAIGDYFAKKGILNEGNRLQLVNEAIIRFSMPDIKAKYHIPLMISPNSYSVWWSS